MARLINAGVTVVLTTHSDVFLQEINNLLHLHDHPERDRLMEELGIAEDELIDPAKARGYEFQETPEGTDVVSLEKRIGGFVVPSMNETLKDLRQETFRLYNGE